VEGTNRKYRVSKVGALEPWCPEISAVESGAQSLFLLGAQTKMMILAKWNPGVELWSPRAPIFLLRSLEPSFFSQAPWSPKPPGDPENYLARAG